MTALFACFVAGVCAAGFVALWFSTAYHALLEKRRSIEGLARQLALHEQLYAQARGGPNEQISAEMLRTNRMLYREGAQIYNRLLRAPANRLPALVLGFHPMEPTCAAPPA